MPESLIPPPESGTPADLSIERDDTYYFHDIIILVFPVYVYGQRIAYLPLIQVEQCLFKVPRFYLERESEVFRDMFQLPSIGDNIHGLREEEPLRLDGISGEDFRQFLKVLYPVDDTTFSRLSLGQWASALKLADMWDMERVKTTAIKRMEILIPSPAERIVLGRQYHVDEWVVQGFMKLIERVDPISIDDGRRIGFEWAFMIAAMRERCCAHNSSQTWGSRQPRGAVAVPQDCADHIRRDLGLT
ncbi:hypothetical protein BD779DRAFT_153819 [Infundibulicybe gibba]|nr:hypothetical protein BD779DRAFT_153819 [Infundibulicybe gibba]